MCLPNIEYSSISLGTEIKATTLPNI